MRTRSRHWEVRRWPPCSSLSSLTDRQGAECSSLSPDIRDSCLQAPSHCITGCLYAVKKPSGPTLCQ
ncbi:hypothetical protein KCV06_g226, partial [Aureobasidium melanogenum]